MEPPSSDEVRTVIEYLLATDPDWGTLVAVIAWTGCRRGEVAGLRWEDVDFKQSNLMIRRSVAAVPGGSQVKGTKTGDIRRIAIGPKTVKLLKDHKKDPMYEPRGATPRSNCLPTYFRPTRRAAAVQPLHDHANFRWRLHGSGHASNEVARSSAPFRYDSAQEWRKRGRGHGSKRLAYCRDG